MSVKVVDLCHTYGENSIFEFKALNNINFEVKSGELIGIIGHTGSGKSTLIQHINRLLTPTSGEIYLDELNINEKGILMKDICSKVGLVFQYPEYQLFEETVYKDIAFGPKNIGMEDIDGSVKKSMAMVGLDFETYKDKSPFELSGGQKRRVAIAGVIAMDPDILILDEPASGLDPVGRKEILDNIYKLHKDNNLTTFLVSHSMTDVCEYASKIMVYSHGELKLFDESKEVFKEVELLKEIGLSIPEGKELMLKLKEKGLDANTDLFTFEDVVKEIDNLI
ncbi:ABC transporter, ATP-binding protein [Anaerofustis stercorihominis DSM 17244]|uniref:Energy-coupling factor transporter ATP-binding protein EcfA2 n=1 Tax=Anaerofustis stercorihominis DSM 17244 TaxID=445971 RepID=B1CA46_9FIRM|nr:energy-coupling factor transporter ATPase [Anaerofustis stercorihominis]EDS72364.1 ABC transporter, ATP-binding protein [Anaerofustis stercorihominis DSM 17244]